MDSSFTIKPPPGVARSRALRDPVPVREAIEAELIGPRTVTAPGGNRSKDHDAGHGDGSDKEPEQREDQAVHDLVVSPDGRDVIYRERDVRASEREHPDHALLRLRAYRPVVTDTDFLPAEDPHADIKA